jgi:hypothetical protein
MRMSLIQWLLPIAIAILEGIILVILSKRKLQADFPFFFSYLVFNICGFLVLSVTVNGSPTLYFYSFWSVTGLGMLFGFAVLYEVFVNVLKPYSAVIDLAKMLFGWAALFLLITAVLTAVATNGPQSSRIGSAVLLMARSVQLMQCGLLLLLVLFETRFGLSWRSPGMSIALGLGISAAVGLSVSYIQARVPGWAPGLDKLDGALRLAILGGWVVALMVPQPKRQRVQDSPKHLILQRWNEALLTSPLVAQDRNLALASVDTFLPGIEKTVDRVLARKIH